jgi:hypothetical protein
VILSHLLQHPIEFPAKTSQMLANQCPKNYRREENDISNSDMRLQSVQMRASVVALSTPFVNLKASLFRPAKALNDETRFEQ